MYFVKWDILRRNKEGVTWAVGASTHYGPDGSGFELGGRDKFRTRPDRPQGPPSLLHGGFRRYSGQDLSLTTHSHLSPRLRKG